MTEELEFVSELPLAVSGTHGITVRRAEAIMARSPEWAIWPTNASAKGVRKMLAKVAPGFDVVGRQVKGKPKVYVRWITPAGKNLPVIQMPKIENSKPVTPIDPKYQYPVTVPEGSLRLRLIVDADRAISACGHRLPLEPGDDPEDVLERHLAAVPRCAAKMERLSEEARR